MSYTIARTNMIKQQLRTGNVLDERILSLYSDIHRDEFVPSSMQSFAYSDMQIPLSHGQCMMTPLEEALLLESLALQGHEVVLEVGTGTGFLTALLSRLCKKVISVDYYPEFTSKARQKLIEHNCNNVQCITGDASNGWLDSAPYDVIVFTGGMISLSEMQRLQLMPGGKIFAIAGKSPTMLGQLHCLDHHGHWDTQIIFETSLPALISNRKQPDFDFQDKTTC